MNAIRSAIALPHPLTHGCETYRIHAVDGAFEATDSSGEAVCRFVVVPDPTRGASGLRADNIEYLKPRAVRNEVNGLVKQAVSALIESL